MVRVAKPSGKTFASLEPQTKNLSEKAIRRRWKRLPVTTQTKLEDLLRTIEQSALASGNNEPQNSEVQTIVGDLVDQYVLFRCLALLLLLLRSITLIRLIERIPRMPFPPGTNDSSFDFESVINHQVGSRRLQLFVADQASTHWESISPPTPTLLHCCQLKLTRSQSFFMMKKHSYKLWRTN